MSLREAKKTVVHDRGERSKHSITDVIENNKLYAPPLPNETLKKLEKMQKQLNNMYHGRSKEIEALLTGLVTNEPVLLVGAVGTAKSSMIEDLGKLVKNARTFTYLMTRFTEPDELFGTIDLQKYKEGKLVRKIQNTALTSDIVFLDEIFKSSSSIRNTLLRVMNEKQYRYGDQNIDVDWLGLFTASNEISYDEEDQAFLDRLVIRQFVEPVLRKNPRELLLKGLKLKEKRRQLKPIISKDEIKQLRNIIDLMVNDFVEKNPKKLEKVSLALSELSEEIELSDRKAVKVLPVSAGLSLVRGKTQITLNEIADAIRYLAPRSIEDMEIINQILEKHNIKEEDPEIVIKQLEKENETYIKNHIKKIKQTMKEYNAPEKIMTNIEKALEGEEVNLEITHKPITLLYTMIITKSSDYTKQYLEKLENRIQKLKENHELTREQEQKLIKLINKTLSLENNKLKTLNKLIENTEIVNNSLNDINLKEPHQGYATTTLKILDKYMDELRNNIEELVEKGITEKIIELYRKHGIDKQGKEQIIKHYTEQIKTHYNLLEKTLKTITSIDPYYLTETDKEKIKQIGEQLDIIKQIAQTTKQIIKTLGDKQINTIIDKIDTEIQEKEKQLLQL